MGGSEQSVVQLGCLTPHSALHVPHLDYAIVGVVAPMFVTSHFSVAVLVYRHSTSTWLPIFWPAVLNVTLLALALFSAMMSLER